MYYLGVHMRQNLLEQFMQNHSFALFSLYSRIWCVWLCLGTFIDLLPAMLRRALAAVPSIRALALSLSLAVELRRDKLSHIVGVLIFSLRGLASARFSPIG